MDPNVVCTHVPERRRYVVAVDGADAGFTAYRLPDDEHVDFVHTEFDDAFAGQGLASTLVAFALADVRAQGKRIMAHCPYVRRWLRHHDDFTDITDWPSA